MSPKRKVSESPDNSRKKGKSAEKSDGIFSGISAMFVERGVSSARLQIWKNRFESLGGSIFDPKLSSKALTYVLAADNKALEELKLKRLSKFKDLLFLVYDWLQTCLSEGKLVSTETYLLNPLKPENKFETRLSLAAELPESETQPEVGTLIEQETITSIKTKTIFESKATEQTLETIVETKQTLERKATSHESGDEGGLIHEEDAELEASTSDEDESLDFKAKLRRKQTFYGKQENPNLNEHLTNPLAEMWHLYEDVLGDQWRSVMYRRAVNKLRGLPYKVNSVEQIRNTPGIGSSLLGKMKEILGTGRLQKLEHLKAQVGDIQVLGSVWGIGAVLARQLYKKGHRTVKDLEKEQSLSVMARIGVKYFDDMSLRIPRQEVAEIESFVLGVVESLAPGAWVNAAGSYRRGKSDCGDVDILITHPDGSSHHDLLLKLVQELRRICFIVDGLHVDENARKGGSQPDMFMGICRLENGSHFRRIDIKVYPRHVYAFALLAFTGNDVLNRKIRFLARVKFGYKLSDQGLFIRESKKKDAKASTESIPCETEKDIFEKLGLDYPEPHDRNW